jgi:hypothetical protein
MRAVGKSNITSPLKPQIRFVDQNRGIEESAGSGAPQSAMRKTAQVVVEMRDKSMLSVGIT